MSKKKLTGYKGTYTIKDMKKPIPQVGGKNNSVKVIMKLIPYHNSYV